jgi:hypothetical protein
MMTEVERRLFESALKEIRDASKEVIEDTIIQAMDTVVKAEDKTEEKA